MATAAPGRSVWNAGMCGTASIASSASMELTTPSWRRACRSSGETGEITGWAGINLDINRLKRTEEALREADRRKDEFLATLAHELRNPLAPIRHAVKLLESKGVDERKHQWAREVISRQVQRMALLLDDLLDVSRITRGRLDLKIESGRSRIAGWSGRGDRAAAASNPSTIS